MTTHVPRLPLRLDPLIAEAKTRARNRRVLLAAVVMIVMGGGVAGAILSSASSFTPTRTIRSAMTGSVLYGGPVVFVPGFKFAFPLRLQNESGQTITIERVQVALTPGAPLRGIGTRWSTYAPGRLPGMYADPGAESPLVVPFTLQPGKSALAALSFRLASCRAAIATHVPANVSGQPFSTLVGKGKPPVRKITVIYRTPSGATFRQHFSETFTFYRSGYGCS